MAISDEELAKRRKVEEDKGTLGFKPNRERHVSTALKAYAYFATSADQGAVKYIPEDL